MCITEYRSGAAGDSAESMWHALADGLGVLLRLELLAEQNMHLPMAFAMYRRSANRVHTSHG